MTRKLWLPLIAAIALIIVGVIYHGKNNNQNNQNQTQTQNNQSAENYYNINELGIKFKADPALKGLTYSIRTFADGGGLVADMASTAVTDKANEVGATNDAKNCGQATMGAFVRLDEYPLSVDRGLPDYTRDFGNFLAYYIGPQDFCPQNKEVQDVLMQQQEALSRSSNTIVALDGYAGKTLEQGEISGLVGYAKQGSTPSNLSMCAVNIDTNKIYCAQSFYGDINTIGYTNYRLFLPTGRFQVYATTDKDPRAANGTRHYYLQNNQPATLQLSNGQTLTGITPATWQ